MATVPPRRRPIVQKIVIPSGLVKPNETVVIEVPSNLKKHAVVIATRPRASKTKDQATEGYGDEAYAQEFAAPVAPANAEQSEEEAYQTAPQDDQTYDVMYELSQAERAEREMLFKNLIEFHRARRNVLEGTKNIFSRSFTTGEGLAYETAAGPQTAVYAAAYQPPDYYETGSYPALPPRGYNH